MQGLMHRTDRMRMMIPPILILILPTISAQVPDPEFHARLLSFLTGGSTVQGQGDVSAMVGGDRVNIRHQVRSLVGLQRTELLEKLNEKKEEMPKEGFAILVMSLILLRNDTGKILPFPHQVMPDKFFTKPVLDRVRNHAKLNSSDILTVSWDSPPYQTLADSEPEHKLWYIREDPLVNSHHWHWHLIYTFGLTDSPVVNLDRRGETFYYMHNQMMARYNTERLVNGMKICEPYDRDAWSKPIPLGYFSKLTDEVANIRQPGRPDNMTLKTTFRYGREMSVDIMEQNEDNILQAIAEGFLVSEDGQQIPLEYVDGIDHGIEHLANIVEISAKELSVNRERYGTLHDDGHLMIGVIHDPDNKHLEPPAAMGYHSSAMRDPLFYPWHHHININIFQTYKASLPAYTDQELLYPGVEILDIVVTADDSEVIDTISTVTEWTDILLPTGIVLGQDDPSFTPAHTHPLAGPGVRLRYKQLHHQPYTINIVVNNNNNQPADGWVRIFMAPHTSEDQRTLMVEIDRFPVTLQPGTVKYSRHSKDSSVTMKIPGGLEYGDLQSLLESGNITANDFNHLGCGWPQHLLISKGSTAGTSFSLFVVISKLLEGETLPPELDHSFTLCGEAGKKFPDKRPMGFPLDRPAGCEDPDDCEEQNWRNLLRGRDNMKEKTITVVHTQTG